ncbi:MAG: hypothetical protein R2726_06755 [Acidimicrobiales bacterium]
MSITTGSDGNLWFANKANASIGRITPAGVVSSFTGTGISGPRGITSGPDGALWFTNETNNSIGRITTSGAVANYAAAGIDRPFDITAGPDGNLWFTNYGNSSIGRITPAGVASTFSGGNISSPTGITAGPDGALWFTNWGGNSIGRITTGGAVSSYSAPGVTISTPFAITTGPDGALWFTNINGSIGRITTAGVVSSFPAGGVPAPTQIVTGPDGNLWFTDTYLGTVKRMTPTGAVTDVATGGTTYGITVGPDGAVWFTDSGSASIGRITTGGAVSRFNGSGISRPEGIVAGPDGNLWFTNSANKSIGRITPAGVVSNFTGSGVNGPSAIVNGPDGNLWFTNQGGNSIGRITPAGIVANFTATSVSNPRGIAAGPDGNLWFTNTGNNTIGRITPTGVITNYSASSMSAPQAITAGPDGALWFTNVGTGTIGRITTGGGVSTFSGPGINSAYSITAGPDGALWFTNTGSKTIGRITTTGTVSSFSAASIKYPNWITSGPDGNLWFTNVEGPSIGRITTAGAITDYTSPDIFSPGWITPGPDGNLWFTDGGNTISTISPGQNLFHPLGAPTRILDSRPLPEQVGPYNTPWGPGTTRAVTVAGVAGVPADATAVTLNVTVTGTTAASFLTLWPAGAPRPTASNLNWSAGQTIPNAVTVKVGADRKINVFNPSGTANVLIDVVGYYDASGTGAGFTAEAPARVLDSRPGSEQVGPYATPWGTGTDRDVTVAGGSTGIPADADAVVANVTVTGTTAESFLTVYPDGATRPTASNLNWRAGVTIPNAVTVKVGANGKIRVFNNSGNVDVIIDVVGYFKTGAGDPFHPVDPKRFQDSRPAPETVGAYTTPWPTATTRTVAVTTANAVPAGAKAVLANVTVTGGTAESFLTVWNTGAASRPTASSLNFKAGTTIANAVTAKVGTSDALSIYNNSGAVNVIADAAGWYG